MKRDIKRKGVIGQVSGEVLLIAAGCAVIWYAGYYTVAGVKKAAHFVAKPFHKHPLPKVITGKK